MEWLLVAVVVLGVPIALVVWLISRASSAQQDIKLLYQRIEALEREVRRFKTNTEQPVAPVPPTTATAQPPTPKQPETPKAESPEPPLAPPPVAQPPPISVPPPQPQRPWAHAPIPQPPSKPSINWEQFMGVKLFAWVGGLALFLGIAFFIKYSFDNNLIPPIVRIALGFAAGLALIAGGVVMSKKEYPTLSQTLCATGVVVLYSATFACRFIYNFLETFPTFLLMSAVTMAAFFLAARLRALVVAILGMLGGFLTPILLSTGQDNPFGLFGYIGILNIGLLALVMHRRWFLLTALAATGTAFMQVGWAYKFFVTGMYFEGQKILIPMGILLCFNLLYLASSWWAKRQGQLNYWHLGSTFALAAVSLTFAAWFLNFESITDRPWVLFGFVFLIDSGVAALVLLDAKMSTALSIIGLAVFGIMGLWTSQSLTSDLLIPALACYFVFAVFHTGVPIVFQRLLGAKPSLITQLFAPLSLVLVLIPIFRLAEVSFVVWPFIFLMDLLAIGLAILSLSLFPVVIVLLLTMGATGILLFKIPSELTGLPTLLFLIGGFAVFFVAAGTWLARKFNPDVFAKEVDWGSDLSEPASLAANFPAFSAVLPFLLLIMATLRLPLTDPTPLFGLATVLVLLMLGLTKVFAMEWMPAVALGCLAALETTWHSSRFSPAQPTPPLVWYLAFLVIFTAFPFLFLRKFSQRVAIMATGAFAAIPQFFLIHHLVKAAHPNFSYMGLLPAVFSLIPMVGFLVIFKVTKESSNRVAQLAWFGGVALFFITSIFPVQFKHQWLTIGWALEGAALLWLFHRVPHSGLRLVGTGLLVAAFVRLALNPAIFFYHTRSNAPLLNWYLYAYGIVTVCLFLGAKLLAAPRNKVAGINAQPILSSMGTVLAFLLMNIEIADYFTEPGLRLSFEFSGSLARDMSYSIGWALFAFALLIYGIGKKSSAARYTALGLLTVTLIKLFFHDLSKLGELYRIIAVISVAIIVILATFAYQRFFNAL